MSDLYQEIILEEYAHPKYKGVPVAYDWQQTAGNASCGDELTVYLTLTDDRLEQLHWEGVGCAISVAAASLLAQAVHGKTLIEVLAMGQSEMEGLIGVSPMAPGRQKCLMLPLVATQTAVQTWQARQAAAQPSPSPTEEE